MILQNVVETIHVTTSDRESQTLSAPAPSCNPRQLLDFTAEVGGAASNQAALEIRREIYDRVYSSKNTTKYGYVNNYNTKRRKIFPGTFLRIKPHTSR